MKKPLVVVAILYFVAMTVFTTFPGVSVANRIEPYILGLPFVLAWYMAWILGSLVTFFFLYRQANRP